MNKSENKRLTTIRLDKELYEKIESISKKEDRTISRQINYIIKDWIKIKEK